MKNSHKWRESIYEKLLFMDAVQNHSNSSSCSAKNSLKPVNFYCTAPRAESVQIVGDFNHWHPLAMLRSVSGWWFIQLQLCHGHHHYRFVVDGKPELDPCATGIARDEHNERASLIAVS
jgi:1,4-alpha-glucan branching enzyme